MSVEARPISLHPPHLIVVLTRLSINRSAGQDVFFFFSHFEATVCAGRAGRNDFHSSHSARTITL